ncbi:helix-turn-helix transcriptional regulator [Phenylobacterium sp. LjRoot225]|uniref:helix-turn-helix transcriptional regulator n=1 Tax=Phenylobacterium sp. LjRoot225 TaxID=3342285 RepID=UPI003ECC5ADB
MIAKRATKSGTAPRLTKAAELRLSSAHLLLMRLNHERPNTHRFFRDNIFWVDLCITPRSARARYIDRWAPHRYSPLGSVVVLPPGFQLELKHEGRRHLSLICTLHAEDVNRWLPADFEWSDNRLEALLDISSPEIRSLLIRLSEEVRESRLAKREVCEALVELLSVEIARYLMSVGESTKVCGLAAWRLKVIDKRLMQGGEIPTLVELASLCDLSVRQLTRAFRATRGCSIREYVSQSRIEAAKRRLATDESIKSISTSLGFASQSTFTYVFRRATGVTPREFRQRLLRALEPRVGA